MSMDSASPDRFLLLKGRETGIWSFSKGHPEVVDKENALRTAARETFEETGLSSCQDYSIIGNSIRFGKRPYWVGLVTDPEVTVRLSPREHSAWGWFTLAQISDLTTNTDVRSWLQKSQGANSEFRRLRSYAALQRMHSISQLNNVS